LESTSTVDERAAYATVVPRRESAKKRRTAGRTGEKRNSFVDASAFEIPTYRME
jgi:hypothetical protein